MENKGINNLEVKDSATKHLISEDFRTRGNIETPKDLIREVALEQVFQPRQAELFRIDSKYSKNNSPVFNTLSSTAAGFREMGFSVQSNTAYVIHYHEYSDRKRYEQKLEESKNNPSVGFISFRLTESLNTL